MTKWLLAGTLYFMIVFAAAFGLGILRVTFIVPAVGLPWATAIELSFVLSISWIETSLAEHLASYMTLAGALGLGGQIAFGLFPLVQYLSTPTAANSTAGR